MVLGVGVGVEVKVSHDICIRGHISLEHFSGVQGVFVWGCCVFSMFESASIAQSVKANSSTIISKSIIDPQDYLYSS